MPEFRHPQSKPGRVAVTWPPVSHHPVPFADLALARRLEHAEGHANAAFVEARARLEPTSGARWTSIAGAFAMFDGPGSPLTQSFGLGLGDTVGPSELDAIESFFCDRSAEVNHEVSPLAGVELFAALHRRGYTPIELTSVMFKPLAAESVPPARLQPRLTVRQVGLDEGDLYAETAVRGWSESPEVRAFIDGLARVSLARADGPCFLAEIDGAPIATAALCLWRGVALLAGASTVPEGRRQGAQLALLDARLRLAVSQGCDLAMMCALPGSPSQRNAERHGFRIAYTRVKWLLTRRLS